MTVKSTFVKVPVLKLNHDLHSGCPKFSTNGKYIHILGRHWKKKKKMRADARIMCDLTVLKTIPCEIKEKANFTFL